MSDQSAKHTVLQILAKPEINKINFSMGSVSFSGNLLKRVRNCIIQNRIGIKHRPNGDNEYDPNTNILYFKFDTIKRLSQEAMVIHECIHAGTDLMNASKMRVSSSEAASYIAQCTYIRLKTRDKNMRLMGDTPEKDKVFEIANELAVKVISKKSLTNSDLNKLREAIGKHPFYKRNYKTLSGWNGIPNLNRIIKKPNFSHDGGSYRPPDTQPAGGTS
jgi:hypothetical protein